MNCTESHDLLLDLAYGELPPARAAEVEAHVLSCAACSADKAKLDDARKAASPLRELLRELEDPPEGFDEPILRAARAEAGLQADGTPGPVVEVSATVKPLGLQAARLDPHAQMRGGKARSQPSWWRRAAAVGSIAAAAGLAVVVTSSLTRRSAERRVEDVAPLQVRAPGAPAPKAIDDALSARGKAAAPEESGGALPPTAVAPAARAREVTRNEVASAPAPAKKKKQADRRDQAAEAVALEEADHLFETRASPKQVHELAASQGALAFDSAESPPAPGERSLEETKRDVARSSTLKSVRAVPEAPAQAAQALSAPPQAAQAVPEAPPQAAQAVPAPPQAAQAVPEAPPHAAQAVPEAPAQAAQAVSEVPPQGVAGGPLPVPPAAAPSPDQLEDQAGAARRSGDYARAAALYRDASALRRQSDPARAAWDLAHAVECLAAGGQVDEAIAARTELLRDYPGQSGPKAAADSALRSVRLPQDEDPAPIKE